MAVTASFCFLTETENGYVQRRIMIPARDLESTDSGWIDSYERHSFDV